MPSISAGRKAREILDLPRINRCEVESAVWGFSMRLLEVAKELHDEIAYDISLFKTSLHTSINCCLFRLKHLQPEILRALAESRVA